MSDHPPINTSKKRILILGGGFGGVYAALHLEKLLAAKLAREEVEICLVSRDNFFLFTPMLHETAANQQIMIEQPVFLNTALLPQAVPEGRFDGDEISESTPTRGRDRSGSRPGGRSQAEGGPVARAGSQG